MLSSRVPGHSSMRSIPGAPKRVALLEQSERFRIVEGIHDALLELRTRSDDMINAFDIGATPWVRAHHRHNIYSISFGSYGDDIVSTPEEKDQMREKRNCLAQQYRKDVVRYHKEFHAEFVSTYGCVEQVLKGFLHILGLGTGARSENSREEDLENSKMPPHYNSQAGHAFHESLILSFNHEANPFRDIVWVCLRYVLDTWRMCRNHRDSRLKCHSNFEETECWELKPFRFDYRKFSGAYQGPNNRSKKTRVGRRTNARRLVDHSILVVRELTKGVDMVLEWHENLIDFERRTRTPSAQWMRGHGPALQTSLSVRQCWRRSDCTFKGLILTAYPKYRWYTLGDAKFDADSKAHEEVQNFYALAEAFVSE